MCSRHPRQGILEHVKSGPQQTHPAVHGDEKIRFSILPRRAHYARAMERSTTIIRETKLEDISKKGNQGHQKSVKMHCHQDRMPTKYTLLREAAQIVCHHRLSAKHASTAKPTRPCFCRTTSLIRSLSRPGNMPASVL